MIKPEFSIQYRNDELYIEGVSARALMSRYGSPLYVYSKAAIEKAYLDLTTPFKGMPVQVCYAVKANSNLSILRLLGKLGAGTDLVSVGEWFRAERADIPREKRVLSGVAKSSEDLRMLMKHPGAGVGSIHVESLMEFKEIMLLAVATNRRVRVAFRFNPDVNAKTHHKISTGRKEDKFGLTAGEIMLAVSEWKSNPSVADYVSIVGLSIHIGSQITNLAPYEKAFKNLAKLTAIVESSLGKALEYLDLGGGIGVRYTNEKTISVTQYVSLIKKTFGTNRKIYLEPGRSLVANAGFLLTQVVANKIRGKHRTLILDSGMNDLMRPALYDAHHELIPVVKDKKIKKKPWDIVGGICETTDYFARARPLAVEGEPGEAVAFLSAGAYGFSMSHSYNSRPRVAEVLVDGTQAQLIRRRETLHDLVQHEENLD